LSDLEPVRSPPSPFRGISGLLGALVLLGVVAAILKPWGAGLRTGAGSNGIASPTLVASPSPSPGRDRIGFNDLAYDPSIFGSHEPAAHWELWPASYLVTFGFVIQLPGAPEPTPTTTFEPNGSPGPAASPTSPTASDPAPIVGPLWPTRFDVPEGNHLFLIGVDMPLGYVLASATLTRATAAGPEALPLSRFESPWPAHFAVVGIAAEGTAGHLAVWPPGDYRLALTFSPGGVSRTIELVIPVPPGGG
jgi:hypothetical protein